MSRNELFELLHQGLVELNQPVDKSIETHLIRFIELIAQWNNVFNLTAIRDLDAMVIRHLLDSLSIKPYLNGHCILDVGTGAGLPGIPLAITLPQHQFVLLDSNQKKTRFLQQAIYQLRLKNVKVVHQRVEIYQAEQLFDSIICRAYSTLNEFLQQTQHLIKPQGQFLAMKGVYPLTEVQQIAAPFSINGIHPLQVPKLQAERHVVEISYLPEQTNG